GSSSDAAAVPTVGYRNAEKSCRRSWSERLVYQRVDDLPRFGIPDRHRPVARRPVARRRGQPGPIGRVGEASLPAATNLEDAGLLVGGRRPSPYGSIGAGRSQPAPIGMESHTADLHGVALQ